MRVIGVSGPSARVIEVIETDLVLRGSGQPDDPYRRVRQYYSKDGELLAERDPHVVWQERKAQTTQE
jgi:hypothetical protein